MLTFFTEVAQYESRTLILKWIYMSVCFGKAPASSCEVPCVSVLCFAHSQAGDASRETENGAQSLKKCLLVAVLVKLASFFGNRRFIVVFTRVPPRALILRHWNALHITPCFSKLFPSVLRSAKWDFALRSGPKLCVNSLRLARLVLPENTQED